MIERDTTTFTVVCDGCGEEWGSEAEWLEEDPCMPERV
jgi:hypothetical protein